MYKKDNTFLVRAWHGQWILGLLRKYNVRFAHFFRLPSWLVWYSTATPAARLASCPTVSCVYAGLPSVEALQFHFLLQSPVSCFIPALGLVRFTSFQFSKMWQRLRLFNLLLRFVPAVWWLTNSVISANTTLNVLLVSLAWNDGLFILPS